MDIFGVLLEANLFQAVEEENRRRQLRITLKNLRDTSNPFEMPEHFFRKMYRLPKHMILHLLLPEVEPHMQDGIRATYVPKHIRVLATLHFLGFGSYQKSVGMDFNISLSQSLISNAINEVTHIFSTVLLPRYIKFPTDQEHIQIVQNGFLEKYNFPNVCGAIDCTHIATVSPPVDHPITPAIVYYNRKGYYSINTQAICDSNLKFLAINARYPGATHDAAIWALSTVNRYLQGQHLNGARNWLLGDSGYPLQPWLLTPIMDAQENTPEGRYTRAHIKARNCIERAFGVLKQRFRCLLKHRVLHYSPTVSGKIIYTCGVLHNLCIEHNIPLEELDDDFEDVEVNLPILDGLQDANYWLAAGRRTRNNLINNHFQHV